MKKEFERYGLKKFQKLTGTLEILGALGLLVGVKFKILAMISSGGLSLLMLLGFGVRIKIKDSLLQSFPAFFFMLLNFYIFWNSLP
jgi:hypothetical protein